MKKELLKKIVRKKINKYEFALITNIYNGENCVYEKNRSLAKSFKKYEKKINSYFNSNKTGIIENTNIFIETYKSPIKVIIIGAVHISQYLINFIKYMQMQLKELTSTIQCVLIGGNTQTEMTHGIKEN